MTKLEAVNTILRSIGQAPVDSIQGSTNVDVVLAESIMDQVSEEVQSQGWHFNIDEDVELSPDSNDEIPLPSDTIYGDVEYPEQYQRDVVVRNGKFYNRTENSFTFDNPIKATLIRSFSFDSLPPEFQQYVTHASAARFYASEVGDTPMLTELRRREQTAYARLQQYDSDTGDYSPYRTPNILFGMTR
jgi:hypothetical protein